jgi:hypothetical protein
MTTWFLEELVLAGKVPSASVVRYREAIRRSLDFLRRDILRQQRFEDFESFFSCSPKPMHYYDSSTAMYSQNTLSMQWCAEAFLQAYRLFGKKDDLRDAEYCLNILSLYQRSGTRRLFIFTHSAVSGRRIQMANGATHARRSLQKPITGFTR